MNRNTSRLATGAAIGALLALAVPLAASAHVEVGPDAAPAGAVTALTFSFQHGCNESPTTSLAVTIPSGVGNVVPVVEGGWSIERTMGTNGVPTRVVYVSDTPIESGLAASVSMKVLFDSATAGKSLAFPVEQTCVNGSTSWSQIAEPGQDPEKLATPAPVVSVGPKSATADAVSGHHATTTTDAAATPAAASDPLARWLGAGGLAAGVIALVVAVVGTTRRRRSTNH